MLQSVKWSKKGSSPSDFIYIIIKGLSSRMLDLSYMVKSGDAVVSALKVHHTAATVAAAAAAREALWCLHETISPTSTLSCDGREGSKSVTQE